jgi:Na+-driven multidrug efflux pump
LWGTVGRLLKVVVGAVIAVGAILRGFGQSPGAGIVALIVAPLIFLLVVIIALARVWLEIVIVVFRIAEYLRGMAEERRVE